MEATVTSKGQITLPKDLREQLHLATGDRVIFLMEEDGSVHLIPKHTSLKDLKGIVPKPEQPVSLEEMERAIEKGASDQ
ncbi:MAG TPA: AbrB/MazE/SpoVT family DNA-binding domain-containing protein [Gammaproteobacteria bacterium]|nr:AbrB/MazE/SpoVT family DNA-binding domain-containing protein [Gammaproteobacteria bacterium]